MNLFINRLGKVINFEVTRICNSIHFNSTITNVSQPIQLLNWDTYVLRDPSIKSRETGLSTTTTVHSQSQPIQLTPFQRTETKMPEPAQKQPNPVHEDPTVPASTSAATEATPGPRATRLQQVFDQALARTLRANSYANFSGCFPTPARHVPASLESVWRQLNAKLEEGARAEFADIVRERDAVGLLNELDRMVGEARARRDGRVNGEGEGEGAGEGEIAYVPFVVLFTGEVLTLV